MVDRGADLSPLSMYPAEREVLCPPLAGLEVQSTRVIGRVLVVLMRLNINLASLTLEQVVSKRLKLLNELADGICCEVSASLSDGLGRRGLADAAVACLRGRMRDGPLSYGAEWCNDDDNFAEAVQHALRLKAELLQEKGVMLQLERSGSAALQEHSGCLLHCLGHGERSVRREALRLLARLPPSVLGRHADELLAVLHHSSDAGVRKSATQALGKLTPDALAESAALLVRRVSAPASPTKVRQVAIRLLSSACESDRLTAPELAQHERELSSSLAEQEGEMRDSAEKLLEQMRERMRKFGLSVLPNAVSAPPARMRSLHRSSTL